MPRLPYVAAIAAALCLASTLAGAPANAAVADPGGCAVRSHGPAGGPARWYYVVRNRCGNGYYFTVIVAAHRYPCKLIAPGGSDVWGNIGDYDTGWSAVMC